MSKFKRLSLTESMERFPLMNEEARKSLRGGCSNCEEYPGYVVTVDEYWQMYRDGTWAGGMVCGLGYVLPDVGAYGEYTGGVDYCISHPDCEIIDNECLGCYYDGFDYCGNHGIYIDRFGPCSECEAYYDLPPNCDHGTPFGGTELGYCESCDGPYLELVNGGYFESGSGSGPDPGSGGTDSGETEEDKPHQKPQIHPNVSLMDMKKFAGYAATGDCMQSCKKIMDNYGCKYGSSDQVFQLGVAGADGSFANYGDNPSQNYQNAVACIDRHLAGGDPLIVGVDYTDRQTVSNPDNTTDHFVVIVGRGYDSEKKMYYYTFMETAANDPSRGCNETRNRFYYDPVNMSLDCMTSTLYPEGMHVTQVRPNDGKSAGQTVDSNRL